MHQPPGNLVALHNSGERWEARQILWCYDRVTRMLEGYSDVARLHLSFSGTLLKQLEDSGVRETFGDVVDIADFLNRYRQSNIEFLGSGLYHPVYPLIPPADWDAQTEWWQGLGRHLLGRANFPGFWPPEMGFCMEMIPTLKRHGYQYVLVDSIYLKPKRELRWEELRYRPYRARYDGAEIIVVPRDRELSNAQLSGLDPGWFQHEVHERTKWCDFPALVTTWTDGENGGWFCTTQVEGGGRRSATHHPRVRSPADRRNQLQLLLGQPLGAPVLRRPGAGVSFARHGDGKVAKDRTQFRNGFPEDSVKQGAVPGEAA